MSVSVCVYHVRLGLSDVVSENCPNPRHVSPGVNRHHLNYWGLVPAEQLGLMILQHLVAWYNVVHGVDGKTEKIWDDEFMKGDWLWSWFGAYSLNWGVVTSGTTPQNRYSRIDVLFFLFNLNLCPQHLHKLSQQCGVCRPGWCRNKMIWGGCIIHLDICKLRPC